jgi:hypothetical protein
MKSDKWATDIQAMLNITNYQRNEIQTTMKYHLTSVRMVLPTLKRMWEGKDPTGGMFLKKLEIEIPYNPAISLLGICKEHEISTSKRHEHCHTH